MVKMVGEWQGDETNIQGEAGSVDNKGEQHNVAGKVARDQNSNSTYIGIHIDNRTYTEPQMPGSSGEPPVKLGMKRGVFILEGSLSEVNEPKLRAMEKALQKITGDATLTVHYAEEGSIRVVFDADPETLDRIQELFLAGELTEILHYPIEDVQPLEEEEEKRQNIVDELQAQGGIRRNFRGANLIGADLSEVDLIEANFRGADLSRASLNEANLNRANLRGADLRGADLSKANLIGADLSGADLIGANLRGADLRGASLSRANLIGASFRGADLGNANLRIANLIEVDFRETDLGGTDFVNAGVANTLFGLNEGLSEEIEADLRKRGAIFLDSPGSGDRVSAPSPSPSPAPA